MTSKLVQELLIKRYEHFKFFFPISDKKIKFELHIKYYKFILWWLRKLVKFEFQL